MKFSTVFYLTQYIQGSIFSKCNPREANDTKSLKSDPLVKLTAHLSLDEPWVLVAALLVSTDP